MWALDRFSNPSGQVTVPSTSPYRSYSPTPRRSTHLPSHARPGPGPRTSSQASLTSNSSLPNQSGQARLPNGSGLKNQLDSRPAPPIEDPLVVLERLIPTSDAGPNDAESSTVQLHQTERPLALVQDVEFDGLSLQEFVDRDNSRAAIAATRQAPNLNSIVEFEKERDKFEDLHKSINGCDDILKSVENYLSSFQTDLGAVSAEIETLQTRSATLNTRLDNRRTVEKLLGPTVDRLGLPAAIVKKISDGPIDEAWIKALAEMQAKIRSLENDDLKHVHAVRDLKPLIEDLSDKAAERIKEYFAAQIKSLRLPNINAQRIQQQGFLKFKPIYEFLAQRQPQLAEEITQAYANTMRWYYYTHFTRYHGSLTRMKLFTTDRYDVIGEDPATQTRHRNPTTSSNPAPSQHDVFNLGRRLDSVRAPNTAAIPAHAAEESKQAHHIETPFHAFNLALVDNASFEYTFLTGFFSPSSADGSAIASTLHRHFWAIFSPVINIGTALTRSLVSETFDALGILILVRLTQHFALTLQRRKTPSLESYINGTNMVLWPRFQVVLDAHCSSLKQLTSSIPSRPGGSTSSSNAFSSLNGGAGGAANTAPHPVTQRFANFAYAILNLSSDAAENEPVSNSFGRLRTEYELFLAKAAGAFGSGEKARKERKRFLANNYSLILTVIGEARGSMADGLKKDFETLQQEVS